MIISDNVEIGQSNLQGLNNLNSSATISSTPPLSDSRVTIFGLQTKGRSQSLQGSVLGMSSRGGKRIRSLSSDGTLPMDEGEAMDVETQL